MSITQVMLLTSQGYRPLRELVERRTLVVVLRHDGCVQDRMHLARLQERAAELPVALGAVGFSPLARLAHVAEASGWQAPMWSDPDRSLYLALRLAHGTFRDVYGLRALRGYARSVRAGQRIKRPHGDTFQLGADVLLDPGLELLRVWRQTNPGDRPSVAEILFACDQAVA